jgi:hypothetical protein
MAFTIITTNKITILFFVLLLFGCSKATIDAEIKEETPQQKLVLRTMPLQRANSSAI